MASSSLCTTLRLPVHLPTLPHAPGTSDTQHMTLYYDKDSQAVP